MVLQKFVHFIRVVRQNGGVFASIKALFIRDDLKDGKFVGEDDYGNKYYENPKYFMPKDRWVHYADHVFLNYDASQVPAEWYGWLHHRTDYPPFKDPTRPKYPWMMPHEENMSGTKDQYVPYSTTMPKIHAWTPPRGSSGGSNVCDQKKPAKVICCEEEDKDREREDSCEEEKRDPPCCGKPPTVFH